MTWCGSKNRTIYIFHRCCDHTVSHHCFLVVYVSVDDSFFKYFSSHCTKLLRKAGVSTDDISVVCCFLSVRHAKLASCSFIYHVAHDVFRGLVVVVPAARWRSGGGHFAGIASSRGTGVHEEGPASSGAVGSGEHHPLQPRGGERVTSCAQHGAVPTAAALRSPARWRGRHCRRVVLVARRRRGVGCRAGLVTNSIFMLNQG